MSACSSLAWYYVVHGFIDATYMDLVAYIK